MLEGKSTGYQLTTLNNEAQSVHPDRDSGGEEGGRTSLPRRKGSSHVKIGEPKHSVENHNNHTGEDVGKHGEGKKGLLTAPAALTTGDTTDTESRRVSDVSSCVSPMTEGRACDNNENNSLHPNQGLLRRGSSDKSPGGSGKGNGSTRRSKGFMRFPSIRRSSGQSDSRGGSRGPSGAKNSRRTDRTSKMLIAVLVLFLLTELPQGIMALLTGTYGQDFLRDCYNKWAEVWDTLALINGAINFILYCFMSKQFRLQFRLIFRLNRYFNKPKWISITTCNHNATISTTV